MKGSWAANPDRIQIVKGWVDKNGKLQRKIYDVALSENREIGVKGQADTPVGDTVDVANASFLSTIGDAELRVVWIDPDFDLDLTVVYYARVIEIPTPTWQAYDMAYFGTQMPPNNPRKHQDRAYTLPIWCTP